MIVLIVFIVVLEIGQFHVVLPFYVSKTKFTCMHAGLDVATRGVANATSFYSVATKFSRLVANLAPKIGDFLLWVNVH